MISWFQSLLSKFNLYRYAKVEELTGRKAPTPAGYFEPLGDFGGEDI
jgi:hypothetical protein